jgi:transcriptional regulator NrdR family protein
MSNDKQTDQVQEGIRCPDCEGQHLRVVYTRQRGKGRRIRKRECRNCGRRFLTVERVAGEP